MKRKPWPFGFLTLYYNKLTEVCHLLSCHSHWVLPQIHTCQWCLMEPHFVSRLFASLSNPHTSMWLLKCRHAHSQKACDFWALPMMGSCKTWRKIRQSWVSFTWLKFFPFPWFRHCNNSVGKNNHVYYWLGFQEENTKLKKPCLFSELERVIIGAKF